MPASCTPSMPGFMELENGGSLEHGNPAPSMALLSTYSAMLQGVMLLEGMVTLWDLHL